MPPEAAAFPKLQKIKVTLDKQNHLIFEAKCAIDAYQIECAKWEEAYGEKSSPKAETMHEKIQRYKEKVDRQYANQPYRSRDKGAR